MSGDAVDRAVLAALAEDTADVRVAREIVAIYLSRLHDRRDALVGARGAAALLRAAHGLRSPSELVGAVGLGARCAAIERAARGGRLLDDATADEVRRECDRVERELWSHLEGGAPG
ncbi:Hpt domain-containing protein [Miltoncostaea oceani]|uniref:Hpt domain-containing protein n=1 Tax=Miltoncostaea oceani TaxID=2843216 RepID=UPI001C3D07CA|nr:Hpt domain-containing protein [Miltoncostaea oceani]